MPTREEMNTQAKELGIENPESFNTKDDLEVAMRSVDNSGQAPVQETEVPADEPVETVEAPAPSKAAQEGSEIASAIARGMENVGKGRPIKITADKSVKSRFAVVRSKKTGDIMLRENASGTLSKVQLKSLEEQEASIQNEEVEDIV